MEYEKTFNLFKRYNEKPNIGKYNESELFYPEFGLVDRWQVTEKIDGMNIRVVVSNCDDLGDSPVNVYGRTDAATLPADLVKTVMGKLRLEGLKGEAQGVYTLFGEGYGPGIQACGKAYAKEKSFVGFDVYFVPQWNIGGYYLPQDKAKELMFKCGFEWVPCFGDGWQTKKILELVKGGFDNLLFADPYKRVQAEGVVAIAPGLFYYADGEMRRLKFKLKTKDFVK